MKRLTTILLVILSSCSISYKFNGASINYETTKTISVANFPTPQAVTENAYASQTRLTISVRVRFTNTKDPQYDIDQTFSGYKDFSSDRMLTDVQDELIQQITDELVDQIFNATVANW